MNNTLKTILWFTMSIALAFGFFHHLPIERPQDFERLHIFLFNLLSGGTIILYYTEQKKQTTRRTGLFFLIALCFAIAAFMHYYLVTLLLPLVLASITEAVRIDRFGKFIPTALFTFNEPISRKFHQAALLCLSLGLVISSFAILNSQFTHWFALDKLTLNTFFLGYSFPVSLISMSVIFSLMKKQSVSSMSSAILKEFSFWSINLGVIIFFLFILCGWFLPQIFISIILFFTVTLIYYLFRHEGTQLQQKAFLVSGILFLVFTAVSGIAYIFLEYSSYYEPRYSIPLMRLHAFTALYGWNLSGLIVIGRDPEFPIRLHSTKVLVLHWTTVLILCPLGYFVPIIAIIAVITYSWLLFMFLFNKGQANEKILQ